MKSSFLFLSLLFIISNCDALQTQEEKPSYDVTIPYDYQYLIKPSDPEVAKKSAQKTISTFIKALNTNAVDDHNFRVKVAYEFDEAINIVWVKDVLMEGDHFKGFVGSETMPENPVQYGDYVTVEPEQVLDWLFTRRDSLKGGYAWKLIDRRIGKWERYYYNDQIAFALDKQHLIME